MLEKFLNFLFDLATSIGIKIIFALIMLFVGFKVAKWMLKLVRKTKLFARMDSSLANFLVNILKVVLYSFVLISIAIYVGVPATSFMAVLTSAGVAIGLALQGSLANLAGGIMIIAFHPFKIGDFIEGNGYSGTVEDVSIFYTKIITPDNKSVMLPNGGLSNAAIVNYSEKDLRRVDIPLSVSYDTDINEVRKLVLSLANKNEKVLKDPAAACVLSNKGESSLDFTLRVWCKNGDYWDVYNALAEATKYAFDENDIKIPFPQMDVHIIGEKK
ncbi:MAG: mechanosensitive ion channel [Clostridia bacterium]|nr:mechanosensitive ion channel [Clostridia bacterium]